MNSIELWLKEATPESATRLDELAETTTNKDERKAARRALYLLSQKGITPEIRQSAERTKAQAGDSLSQPLETLASAFDGAGNRLLFFVLPEPDHGAPLFVQILINDLIGIRDLDIYRKNRREIAEILQRFDNQLESGLAVATIEPDYARHLVAQYREINRNRSKTTPPGFLDIASRIGEPSDDHSVSPVYSAFPEEDLENSSELSREPVDLFKLPWFDPWFFAVEEVVPWLDRWIQAENSKVVFDNSIKEDRKRSILKEAAVALLPDPMRALYVTRLEESADVLRRRGKQTEAEQALYHAIRLKDADSGNQAPFALALVQRTIEAAMEMVANAEAKSEAEAE